MLGALAALCFFLAGLIQLSQGEWGPGVLALVSAVLSAFTAGVRYRR